MSKKLLILSLSIAMLFAITVFIAPVDAKDKRRVINWRIAGPIIQLIELYNPANPEESIGKHSLINVSAHGSPGRASITMLGRAASGPTGTTLECEDGYFPIAEFEANDFVALFPDQSLLFASMDMDMTSGGGGILCLNSTTFANNYFKAKMLITGGTGRFEGAGGSFTGEGYGYPVSFNGTLGAENGKLTGTIEFSD